MHHIKYKATLTSDGMSAIVEILEQTHRNYRFSPSGGSEFIHGRVRLCSSGCPENDFPTIFMRGNSPTRDKALMTLNIKHYKEFKAAVLAYNAAGIEKAASREMLETLTNKIFSLEDM